MCGFDLFVCGCLVVEVLDLLGYVLFSNFIVMF